MLHFLHNYFASLPHLSFYSYCSFLLLKAIAISFPLLLAIAFRWKRTTTIVIAIVGRAITIWGVIQKKKPGIPVQNLYKKWSKEIKSDNFWYRKVGRAITKLGPLEKLRQFCQINPLKLNQRLFHILGAPIIFSSTIKEANILAFQWYLQEIGINDSENLWASQFHRNSTILGNY